VPKTRSQLGLPAFNPKGEDLLGSNVSAEVSRELWEALGDSPLGAAITSAGYLVSVSVVRLYSGLVISPPLQLIGWPSYLLRNASGQRRYGPGNNRKPRHRKLTFDFLTNRTDFNPKAVMFGPHQHDLIVLSDIGVLLWIAGIATWTYYCGFAEVFTLYLVPYLWCAILCCHLQSSTLTFTVSQDKPLARLDHVFTTYRPPPSPFP